VTRMRCWAALALGILLGAGCRTAPPRPTASAPGSGDVIDAVAVEPVPTGEPASDEVRINETVWHQTMDGFGVNTFTFPFASGEGWSWGAVSSVFEDVDINYVRFKSPFRLWERWNDNPDPYDINWDFFDPTGTINNHDLAFARYLRRRGIEVSLGVWDAEEWLASGSPRSVNRSMYLELGESIASYLLRMQKKGIPQPWVEVQNEPAIEAKIQYSSPEDLRDAALALVEMLDHHGLADVMLHGPNHHKPSGAAEWAEVWLADDLLRSRTVAVSYHTWWDSDPAPYERIRQVAERYHKPVWATEVGYCPLKGGCFEPRYHYLRPETWGTAWDYAMSYYRAIAWSHASRVYHWSLLGWDALVSPNGWRFPSFYVVKRFAGSMSPGSRLLEVASGDAEVLVLAFAAIGGSTSVVLLNQDTVAKRIRLTSVAGYSLRPTEGYTTCEDALEKSAEMSGPNDDGRVTVTLPARSVSNLVLQVQRTATPGGPS